MAASASVVDGVRFVQTILRHYRVDVLHMTLKK